MMRRTIAVLSACVLGVTGTSVTLRAQGAQPVCTVTPSTAGNAADVCRKAADIFAFIVPQFGVALAGGNSALGEGGTLGGWGKRSATLRVTAVDGRLPENDVALSLTPPSAQSSDFGASRVPIPMASLDAAIGIYTGFPSGVTNLGGVDVLVGLVGVPSVTSGDVTIKPEGSSVALSYGVRVGLVQESSFVPGISINWMRRKVPTLNLEYAPNNDTVSAQRVSLTADAFRAVISKRFTLMGLAAGFGRDKIEGGADLNAIVNESGQRTAIASSGLNESIARSTAFVNASFGISAARVVAEYGRSSAGAVRETLNTFGDRSANEAYSYGSLGVTIRF
jgi:hypothetical protein